MTIHTVGDSHSLFGWPNYINKCHVGPMLCYSFGKEKLNRIDIRKYNMKDGDTIIFSLGEIDCRGHIYKYITETNTYQNIIDNIVQGYFEAIHLNIATSLVKFKNVCIYNVVPTIVTTNIGSGHPVYPWIGDDSIRKEIVLYFNKMLKEKCEEYNYIFFDIFHKYTDNNGFLNTEFSDGSVHIKDGKYLNEFIIENDI